MTFVQVTHDCRLMSDYLHHHHNIRLINVFDTQVRYRHHRQNIRLINVFNTQVRYRHPATVISLDQENQSLLKDFPV